MPKNKYSPEEVAKEFMFLHADKDREGMRTFVENYIDEFLNQMGSEGNVLTLKNRAYAKIACKIELDNIAAAADIALLSGEEPRFSEQEQSRLNEEYEVGPVRRFYRSVTGFWEPRIISV